MNEIRQRQKELLDETVVHFNSTNRAYDDDTQMCSYDHSYNGGCAIGRKLPRCLAEDLDSGSITSAAIWARIPNSLKELGANFLLCLQSLHDEDFNWDEHGLTFFGKLQYEGICERYELS